MEREILSWKEARHKSIISVLSDFGIAPKKQTGKAAWYLSPLRTEREPSFCVTLNKNLWYDFGIAKGGNVIDLVILLKSCSPLGALGYLSSKTSFFFNPPVHEKSRKNLSIQVTEIKKIQHPALIQYLRSRAIPVSVANMFCKEVWYLYNGSRHFSIGLSNSSGGWELRNKFYKNSTTPKSYSLISIGREKERLLIFEGMFDFLSLATMNKELVTSSDCLVLNSLGLLNKSFQIINNYQEIHLYLDGDPAGQEAVQKLNELQKATKDCSFTYRGFKDLNEKLMLLPQRL